MDNQRKKFESEYYQIIDYYYACKTAVRYGLVKSPPVSFQSLEATIDVYRRMASGDRDITTHQQMQAFKVYKSLPIS